MEIERAEINAGQIDDVRGAAAHLLKLRPDFRVSHSVEALRMRSAVTRDIEAFQASGLPPAKRPRDMADYCRHWVLFEHAEISGSKSFRSPSQKGFCSIRGKIGA